MLPSSSIPETEDERPIDTNKIDLCNFKNINLFLIADKRLYILHEKWLWILNPTEMIYTKPVSYTHLYVSRIIPESFPGIGNLFGLAVQAYVIEFLDQV